MSNVLTFRKKPSINAPYKNDINFEHVALQAEYQYSNPNNRSILIELVGSNWINFYKHKD